jgi:hypothetical protein
MTRQQHKELAALLHSFYRIEPEGMQHLVDLKWHPFVASLHSDEDRAFALSAYFDLVNYNFSQLLIRLGQLSEEELAPFRPLLADFKKLEKEFIYSGHRRE